MEATEKQVMDGQAVYTREVLSLYDFIVLNISNSFIWKCPTKRLVRHYNNHISANHLDVGVGTGYFLSHCRYPEPEPRIALMDLNPNALEYASGRIKKYNPEKYRKNVLEPIEISAPGFDSVAVNFLLHCLPGTIRSKSVVFNNLKGLMNDGAVIFGATLLGEGVQRTRRAKHLMNLYNKKGIFSNHNDSLDDLKETLNLAFRDVSIETVGCVAVFSGRK